MPYRRKDSPLWWASYTGADGKRVRRPTGTADRKEAEALEAKWKLEAHQQKAWGKAPDRSFDEMILAYLKAHAHKKSADRDLGIVAKHLRPAFSSVPANRLAASHVRAYVEARRAAGAAPATVNRETALLSAALNWARTELEWDVPNPVPGRKLKTPEGRVRWITRDQAAALLAAARAIPTAPHLADLIALALHTGMRREEMLGLRWAAVDLKADLIHLGGERTKSGKRRSIPLNADARAALISRAAWRAEHCPASPWVFAKADGARMGSCKKSFAAACRAAGIDDFHFHDLRHTCAAWLVGEGAPLVAVRDLLGHSSVKVTEIYAHLAPDNVRAAVSLIASPPSSVTIKSRGK